MDIVEGVEGCSLILKNDESRWFRLEGFALSRGGGALHSQAERRRERLSKAKYRILKFKRFIITKGSWTINL